jgi:uncharacterized protein YjbJ (UPF0337 family)
MGIQDKVSGRLKQAAGDLTGNEKLRRDGVRDERKGDAKQELREAQEQAERKRDEIAQLEYETDPQTASFEGKREERAAGQPQEHDTRTGSDPRSDDAADFTPRDRR